MSNRFMISVAALALVAGTGLANAQGTTGRESGGAGGAQMQHSQQPPAAPPSAAARWAGNPVMRKALSVRPAAPAA